MRDVQPAMDAPGIAMTPRTPTAAARTVSLFTGRSDVDDPRTGRDGTKPDAHNDEPRRRHAVVQWNAVGFTRWVYGTAIEARRAKPKHLGEITKLDERRYVARAGERSLGVFATVLEAASAVEGAIQ